MNRVISFTGRARSVREAVVAATTSANGYMAEAGPHHVLMMSTTHAVEIHDNDTDNPWYVFVITLMIESLERIN